MPPPTRTPQVKLLGNGSVLILPQVNYPATKTAAGGGILRISYTATVPQTGLSCTGVVELCSIKGGAGKKPPACAAFASTQVARNALTCS